MKGLAEAAVKPSKNKEEAPAKEGSTDMKLVNLMGEEAVEAGADKLGPAIQRAGNPGIALGQIVGQMALQIGSETMEEMDLDPAVFLKEGGFVDNTIDYAIERFELPKEVKQPAFVSAVELLKAAKQSGDKAQQPQQGAPQPEMGGAPPVGLAQQGGMPV